MDSHVQTVLVSPMVPRLMTLVGTALAVRPDGRPVTVMAFQAAVPLSIVVGFAVVIQVAVRTVTAFWTVLLIETAAVRASREPRALSPAIAISFKAAKRISMTAVHALEVPPTERRAPQTATAS